MQHFDVLIVGGGMAGATAAVTIKKQLPDSRIAVIEAFEPKAAHHPSFDDRSLALAEQSVSYLRTLGLFDPHWTFAEPITQVHVSDRGHFGKTTITHDEFAVEALGYVVEVNPYGAYLHQQLSKLDIALYCPAKITSLHQQQTQVDVVLDSDETLSGKLLVVADGAQSPTRSKLNIGFDSVAYEQGALIANVQISDNHQGQAFERFTEHGPMALLPMSNNRYSLVWCMPQQELDTLRECDETEFLARLQSAFGYRAGMFERVGRRTSYPLVLGRVEQLVHHRCVLIGNAAHAIHPIAGQGFNLGLRDIQALVAQLQQTEREQWGSHAFTQSYKTARESDINRVMTLTDSLVRLFSNDSRMLALGRSCGLLSMSLFSQLKAPLARQLMGRTL
ncbi:2-octaprenyl-6-methoxyphenyl hydroxylase [Pseudoalteromonas rubra]|uniref:2-octaprenyl-6-methoxyphenyl hydroxylase n=1 Tax=Pseudoalteromonas rubra TaxID=43658 RepID=A0A5S3WSN1_9GAMM|nr:2-octaprenyl-6-methoxyphenyl hydroxylase [Pseudoalteromonas rubra]TMP29270.1 2-octaprenyl-6-methoxyphenyl hydroxylase [Pseudoalteromonas rubra]TMP32087.1 2-octaprenyl-6-methoxyphenyl hydroxylase [Pseudoalteromonas rubra]